MEHSAFINIDLLSQEAKKELETFYEFLLFKYKQPRKATQDDTGTQVKKFRGFSDNHQVQLPADDKERNDSGDASKNFSAISIDTKGFKFDREKANER